MKTEQKIMRNDGFTLIELLVVVVIIAIVGGVALSTKTPPSAFINSAAKELYSAVIDARQDAIRSGRSVIFQTSERKFVSIYRDENGSGAIDNGDIARTVLELPMHARLSENLGPVFFNNRGYLVDAAGQPTSLSIRICQNDDDNPELCKGGGYLTRVDVNLAGVADIVYPR